ncbi:hypothetical protein BH10CYA1_BH10CYA1_04250 [soil metagenome]
MANVEHLSKQIEQGIAKHDPQTIHQVLHEMHSWKAHGSSQKQIDVALQDLSHKLHKDGYLPGISIIGFDKNHDSLIVSDKSKHSVHVLDASLHKVDKHEKQLETKHERPLTPEEKQELTKLEKNRGVTVEKKGDQFVYHLKANGKDEVVLNTEASLCGLRDGDTTLQQQIKSKELQLTADYHVQFCDENENGYLRDTTHPDLGYVKTRMPRLDELAGVEAALKHSAPAQLKENRSDTEGVKFYFLKEKAIGAAAFYTTDSDGKAAVFMEPGKRYPTEVGAQGDQVRGSIQAVLTHELAHNSQHKTGWNDPETKAAVAAKIGWVKSENSDEYYFKDKQGHLFKNFETSPLKQPDYMQCNIKGEPVDEKGKVVDASKAKHLRGGDENDRSADTMFGNALVRPVTHYFPTPTEMFADGMQAFRLDQAHRANLLRESPLMYRACKQEDQKEISTVYGWGRMVRDTNGELVRDTPEERLKIQAFEKQTAQ